MKRSVFATVFRARSSHAHSAVAFANFRTATLALATLVLAPCATTAADLMPYGQPAPVRSMFWQGPYVGANLGYQWGSVSNTGADPNGVAGGLQAGYNWQHGQFVFGGETDLQMSDADDRFAGWKFSNPWFGTLRGRAGYAMNNILFYGTAGLAYGTLRAQSSTGISESRTTYGWTAGAGLEVALTGNWSAKAEYLYVDLNNRTFALDSTDHGIASSLLRFGVNYRF